MSTDARKRMRFDLSPVAVYEAKQQAEKQRKQMEYEAKVMAKLQPKQLVVATSIASQIAGSEYTKGVKNGKN